MSPSRKAPDLNKKTKIIKAALEIMCESGATLLKLNEVAHKAKVPPPLIHYYYKNIEDLYFDVILLTLESLKEYSLKNILTDTTDSIKNMRNYIEGPFFWAKEKPGYGSIWLYFYYLSHFSMKFKMLNTQIRTMGRERISLMIFQGIQNKQFKIDPSQNVFELAEEIQALITGQATIYATEQSDYNMEKCLKLCTNRVLKLLGVEP